METAPNVVPIRAPVVPRTNLATVTYPVSLASASQMNKSESPDALFGADAPVIRIPQFSILLSRKDTVLKTGAKTIPVFSQLNKIACKAGVKNRYEMRKHLLKELRFAGIAFTGVEEGNGDGTPNMIASVIGGSHTVMSYRADHKNEPLMPGTVVRWTIPRVDEAESTANGRRNDVPVQYYGTGTDIFAELEEVDSVKDLEVIAGITGISALIVKKVLEAVMELREREIGVVIGDNGKGSIDIRLK